MNSKHVGMSPTTNTSYYLLGGLLSLHAVNSKHVGMLLLTWWAVEPACSE